MIRVTLEDLKDLGVIYRPDCDRRLTETDYLWAFVHFHERAHPSDDERKVASNFRDLASYESDDERYSEEAIEHRTALILEIKAMARKFKKIKRLSTL